MFNSNHKTALRAGLLAVAASLAAIAVHAGPMNVVFRTTVYAGADASYDKDGTLLNGSSVLHPPARNAEIYDNNTECADLIPVMTPDGSHHVTLGEWQKARGEAHARCVPGGVEFRIKLQGLLPKGVYTFWFATFTGEGMLLTPEGLPDYVNLIGLGALGLSPNATEEERQAYLGNKIEASDNGHGELTIFQPAGALSMFGTAADCLFGGVPSGEPGQEVEVTQVALWPAYHLDGRTGGPVPHPDDNLCTIVFPGGFIFTK